LVTRIVLDSSAIAAIFFPDPLSGQIEQALPKYDEFYTVDLAYAEVGNVAWKRVRIFKEDRAHTFKSLNAALEFIQNDCKVIESKDILRRALAFAVDNDITTYDAIFVAAAKRLKTKVLCADERLFHKIRSKNVHNLVMLPTGEHSD
jgi:predicted nucleic acid-binding protein